MATREDFLNLVDRITRLPGDAARQFDEVNDRVIKIAQDVQAALEADGQTAGIGDDFARTIEANLRQNKIEATGRRFAAWISEPKNLGLFGLGLFVVLTLVFTLGRGTK